jgi:hypothetical protein
MTSPNQPPRPEHPRVRALLLVAAVVVFILVLAASGVRG